MRHVLLTIVVATLVTACSGVQGIFRTNSAANVELIDEENRPPNETESDAELEDGKGFEPPESVLGDGNPQYAESPAALEDSEPTPDIGSPEYADEYYWLDEAVDNNTEEVIGC